MSSVKTTGLSNWVSFPQQAVHTSLPDWFAKFGLNVGSHASLFLPLQRCFEFEYLMTGYLPSSEFEDSPFFTWWCSDINWTDYHTQKPTTLLQFSTLREHWDPSENIWCGRPECLSHLVRNLGGHVAVKFECCEQRFGVLLLPRRVTTHSCFRSSAFCTEPYIRLSSVPSVLSIRLNCPTTSLEDSISVSHLCCENFKTYIELIQSLQLLLEFESF